MTEPDPGAVFVALAELARRYPHWRAGQVVANAAGWAGAEVWDVEDSDLLAAVQTHLSGGHAAVASALAVKPAGSPKPAASVLS